MSSVSATFSFSSDELQCPFSEKESCRRKQQDITYKAYTQWRGHLEQKSRKKPKKSLLEDKQSLFLIRHIKHDTLFWSACFKKSLFFPLESITPESTGNVKPPVFKVSFPKAPLWVKKKSAMTNFSCFFAQAVLLHRSCLLSASQHHGLSQPYIFAKKRKKRRWTLGIKTLFSCF